MPIFFYICPFTEAADNYFRNQFHGRLVTDEDRNKIDPIATSRLPTLSAPLYNPSFVEHDALDLHRYQPNIRESSEQARSKGQYL